MAGKKRKSPQDSSDGVYSNKSRSRPSAEAKIDPTFGQRSAIPGLDDETLFDEEGLVYDEDMDALAYLKSVRQEAFGIPTLLVAPKTPVSDLSYDIYEDGVGDFRGRYEDGAYVAAAEADDQDPPEDEAIDQAAYFDSIISRYHELRSRMEQVPPDEVVQALGLSHPTHVGPLNKPLTRAWIKRMRSSDPKPAQIACMDKGTVLRLLRLLTRGSILRGRPDVDFGASYWAWSLLAKLPDRGELNSEEIGVVRELGKKAVLVGMGLKENKDWEQGIQDVEEQFEEDLDGEGIAAANEDEINLEMEGDLYEEECPEQAVEVDQTRTDNHNTQTESPALPTGFDELDVDGEADLPVSASSQPTVADNEHLVTAEHLEDLNDRETQPNEVDVEESEALAAMKVQAMNRLKSPETEVNIEPEVSTEPKPRPEPSKMNTRATVDMIITIAGEMYGQRDLLEFRREWAHIM